MHESISFQDFNALEFDFWLLPLNSALTFVAETVDINFEVHGESKKLMEAIQTNFFMAFTSKLTFGVWLTQHQADGARSAPRVSGAILGECFSAKECVKPRSLCKSLGAFKNMKMNRLENFFVENPFHPAPSEKFILVFRKIGRIHKRFVGSARSQSQGVVFQRRPPFFFLRTSRRKIFSWVQASGTLVRNHAVKLSC